MDAGNPVGPDGYVNFQNDGSIYADNMCTVMVSDGSWIQTPCDQTFAFICQMPAGIVKVSFFFVPFFILPHAKKNIPECYMDMCNLNRFTKSTLSNETKLLVMIYMIIISNDHNYILFIDTLTMLDRTMLIHQWGHHV